MDRSTASRGTAANDMRGFATQLRESAELGIVKAYRQSVAGEGDGPSDVDLRVFARLVAYEIKLEQRLAAMAIARAQAVDAPPCAVQVAAPIENRRDAATQAGAIGSPAPSAPAPRRRTMPSLVLAYSCVLMVCGAMASWVVGNGSPAAAPPTAVVSQSPDPAPMPERLAVVAQPVQPALPQADSPAIETDSLPLAEPTAATRKAPRKPPVHSTGSRTTERAREIRSGSLVASCGGLNFLSRAVCMNNVCAQPDLTGSRPCADAVRQRRIDEARRNPTLMG